MTTSQYPYSCTKTYGHERGFSCAFRQWRAESHCSKLHGYALSFEIEFRADALDDRLWVVDFGAMGSFKQALSHLFDHTTAVASDDPLLDVLREADGRGLLNLRIFTQGVGCEMFAKRVYDLATEWLASYEDTEATGRKVIVHHVTVREHGSNSATYYNPT